MYKLSEPFDSQALESFESRVLASETKFEYSRALATHEWRYPYSRLVLYFVFSHIFLAELHVHILTLGTDAGISSTSSIPHAVSLGASFM